jgi:hypothetical protein
VLHALHDNWWRVGTAAADEAHRVLEVAQAVDQPLHHEVAFVDLLQQRKENEVNELCAIQGAQESKTHPTQVIPSRCELLDRLLR